MTTRCWIPDCTEPVVGYGLCLRHLVAEYRPGNASPLIAPGGIRACVSGQGNDRYWQRADEFTQRTKELDAVTDAIYGPRERSRT